MIDEQPQIPAYWPFDQVTQVPASVNYPEPVEQRRGSNPLLIALVILALVLFLTALALFVVAEIRHDRVPAAAMPTPAVVMTTTVTPEPSPGTGDSGWLSGLHLMGYPVPDPDGSLKIGRGICANLRAGNGIVPRALEYLQELGNAPEGFNQGDAIGLVWLAEDAYCPEQPRQ
jgi:hypothetical protein